MRITIMKRVFQFIITMLFILSGWLIYLHQPQGIALVMMAFNFYLWYWIKNQFYSFLNVLDTRYPTNNFLFYGIAACSLGAFFGICYNLQFDISLI
ncbi:MAG: hypothetical protein ATN36_02300 [Epulopiscium sp. Nele67-Bin005]|nr:MAG: hypothetical protein ATN36_02300 [Epulopiscium sp. Nele67-Bin005]